MKTSNPTKKLECSLYFLPAGNGDCILIQYQDDESVYHNILIDGGNRNQLEFQKQKRKILEVLDEGRKGRLDLVIVTHSDDDHIKGILKLVMDKQLEGYVDKFWFNSEKTISELLSSPFQYTQPYLVDEQANGAERSSRNQDHDLYHELDKNSKWGHDVISFPKEEVIGNLKLTVLSPTIEKLQKLDDHWPQMPLNAKNVSRSAKCVSDHKQSLNQLMENLSSFEEDTSPVNGASIALMLEWCSRRFLLLSDSHPSVIVDNLADYILADHEALDFDLVKVSHHGSRNNTNDELLSVINCENFIVTTNGKRHCHPHKDCLARIIKKFTPNGTKIYFNHDNEVLKGVFRTNEFKSVYFPQDKEEGIRFTYES